MIKTPVELVAEAFSRPRDPRSAEYKEGMRARLWMSDPRNDEPLPHKIHCPYPMGTASADAFFAGVDEGRMILENEIAKERQVEAIRMEKVKPPLAAIVEAGGCWCPGCLRWLIVPAEVTYLNGEAHCSACGAACD